ncbi:hypothetical protein D3C87_1628160 [compost metagenome]
MLFFFSDHDQVRKIGLPVYFFKSVLQQRSIIFVYRTETGPLMGPDQQQSIVQVFYSLNREFPEILKNLIIDLLIFLSIDRNMVKAVSCLDFIVMFKLNDNLS